MHPRQRSTCMVAPLDGWGFRRAGRGFVPPWRDPGQPPHLAQTDGYGQGVGRSSLPAITGVAIRWFGRATLRPRPPACRAPAWLAMPRCWHCCCWIRPTSLRRLRPRAARGMSTRSPGAAIRLQPCACENCLARGEDLGDTGPRGGSWGERSYHRNARRAGRRCAGPIRRGAPSCRLLVGGLLSALLHRLHGRARHVRQSVAGHRVCARRACRPPGRRRARRPTAAPPPCPATHCESGGREQVVAQAVQKDQHLQAAASARLPLARSIPPGEHPRVRPRAQARPHAASSARHHEPGQGWRRTGDLPAGPHRRLASAAPRCARHGGRSAGRAGGVGCPLGATQEVQV